jgi:hypothetical protein
MPILSTNVLAITKPSTGAAFLLLGATVLFIGSAVALMAPVDDYKKAGCTKSMERYGRFAAYIGAFLAYLGAVIELPASLKALGAISLVLVGFSLLALFVVGKRLGRRVNRE